MNKLSGALAGLAAPLAWALSGIVWTALRHEPWNGGPPSSQYAVATLAGIAAGLALGAVSDARRREALTDRATQVGNRDYLMSECGQVLAAAAGRRRRVTLVVVGFDAIAVYSSAARRAQSDAILRVAASRMRRQLGRVGLLARLGGDEFAIVLPRMGYEGSKAVVHRMSRSVHDLGVTFSFGMAAFSGTETTEELIAAAQIELEKHKRRRKQAAFGQSQAV